MENVIYLRPLRVDDAEVSWRWRNDSSLWKYTGHRPDCVVTEAMERQWADKVIHDASRLNYAICLVESQRYIGNIYIVNIEDSVGELGIFIGEKDCHGKGYGQQALELLKREAKTHHIKKIKVGVNSGNIPALVTYLKQGGVLLDSQWLNLELTI